jgi:phosphoglycerate kinase
MDYILVGGAAANTFLKAKGLPIGSSLFEPKAVASAKKLLNKKIILPIDGVVASKLAASRAEGKSLAKINQREMILDIGPETVALFQGFVEAAKMVVWNGPMGYLENPLFRVGDGGIIEALKKSRAKSFVGGGETLLALDYFKAGQVPTFCSTGGGAMLDFLAFNGDLKSLQFLN